MVFRHELESEKEAMTESLAASFGDLPAENPHVTPINIWVSSFLTSFAHRCEKREGLGFLNSEEGMKII